MSEDAKENFVEITEIREFSKLGKDLEREEFFMVEYLLNGKLPGVVTLKKTQYTKERVLELALEIEAKKHPDIGEVIHG